jgi:hypothetical protein
VRILLDILFGLVGMGYWYSGKSRGNTRFMVCGVILGLFPYLVGSNLWLTLLIGGAACAFPFVFPED